MAVEQLLERLGVSLELGLSAAEVQQRRETFGPNQLMERRSATPLGILVRQFKDLMVLILLAATLVALVSWWIKGAGGFPSDVVVILAIVIANAGLGFAQEYRAERTIEELQRSTAARARVVRDGQMTMVEQAELVPGDVVVVHEGDRIPADLVLARSNHLQINESLLTGESLPVSKRVGPMAADTPPEARTGGLFAGTTVTAGEARAVVVATGSSTELGGIAASLTGTASEATPLERRLNVLGRQIGWGVLLLAAIIGVTLLAVEGRSDTGTLVKVAMFAVALAVAAVPEGLPAVLTVSLSAGARRLASRKAVARRMAAVETLGAVTVVVTDKTGTLTHNEMTVRGLFLADELFEVTGEGYRCDGVIQGTPPGLEPFLRCATLANNAELETSDGRLKAVGDPMDAALLVLAEKAGYDWRELRRRAQRISHVPFSSERARTSCLCRIEDAPRLFVKGSVEVLVERATHFLSPDGRRLPLDADAAQRFREAENRFARQALRSLAMAVREDVPPDGDAADLEQGLTLLGLAAFGDPPREEAAPALTRCREAGIKVVMLTGDHPDTASAVAHQTGLAEPQEQAVTGRQLAAMSDQEFEHCVGHSRVLARVSPAQKLKVVQSLINQGEVVAMTGDGVNDAPALKKVHVGIAMGRSGTAVAVEASDLVLLDDNFSTIVGAVEEGRSVYANVQRFIAFLFSGNFGVVTAMFVGTILAGVFNLRDQSGILLPLTAAQILWMNLVTDGAPAIAFALGPSAKDVMQEPPRDPRSPILTRRVWLVVGLTGLVLASLFLVVLDGLFAGGLWTLHSDGPVYARTAAFYTLVTARLLNSLNFLDLSGSLFRARCWANRFVPVASLLSWVLTLAVIYLPRVSRLFGLSPLHWHTLLVLTLITPPLVLLPAELFKRLV